MGTLKGHSSDVQTTVDHSDVSAKFGCTDVPYAEPYWYYGNPQPYYGASHAVLRRYIRGWVEKHLSPKLVNEMDDSGTYPPHLHDEAAKAGLYHLSVRYCLLPLVKSGVVAPPALPAPLRFEELDEFHDLIAYDELARCGAGGVLAGVRAPQPSSIRPHQHHSETQH